MRVKVEFEAKVIDSITREGEPYYSVTSYPDYSISSLVKAEWCTQLDIEEPTEAGFYVLTFKSGYTEVVRHVGKTKDPWEMFGYSKRFYWVHLLRVISGTELLSARKLTVLQ